MNPATLTAVVLAGAGVWCGVGFLVTHWPVLGPVGGMLFVVGLGVLFGFAGRED